MLRTGETEVPVLPSVEPPEGVDRRTRSPSLTENVGVSKKTEHFTRWLQYLRHLVQHGLSYVHLCRTHDMRADPLTKVVARDAFYQFVKLGCNRPE